MTNAVVTGICVYPIKACGAVRLDAARVLPQGLDGDRRYMLVGADGRFVSQRTHPILAQVRCTLGEEEIGAAVPGLSPLTLPRRFEGTQHLSANIWRDQVLGTIHADGSAWFSAFLSEEVTLVYQPESELRRVNPKHARPEDRVSFADGYPLLLTSESSLEELNRHCEQPVPMDRFRPNVVISGWPAYAEDTLKMLMIGDVSFVMPKLCDRCVVTTTDQLTGKSGREPLRALAKTRKWDGAVWFGANLIPHGAGMLAVGQTVTPVGAP